MRGKTDLPPQPSTKLAFQLGKLWGDPAANDRANGAAVSGSAANTFALCPRAFKAAAIPHDKPPPPNAATTQSTSGKSSRISRPAEALPAINASSSNGWINAPVIAGGARSASACQHWSYEAFTTSPPRRRTASNLAAGAASIMRILQGTPALRAASATPWAALPALTVQTPRRLSFSGKSRTALYAPRILKEPMGCRHSNFRKISDGPS